MKIVARYDFNGGKATVEKKYPQELREITDIITSVDSSSLKIKVSKEKTMVSRMLFSPIHLNGAFKEGFLKRSWINRKVDCTYEHGEYLPGVPNKSNAYPSQEGFLLPTFSNLTLCNIMYLHSLFL